MTSDAQLLDRFVKSSDQQAFAELVRRHVDWVNSMSLRLVRDPALAADVTLIRVRAWEPAPTTGR